MRDLANLRLGHSAQWHQCAAQLRLTQTEKEIRLILPQIDTLTQDRVTAAGGGDPGRFASDPRIHTAAVTAPGYNVLDDGVMTGRDVIAAESLRFAPEVAELEFLIAHHARVRRSACLILSGEIVYYDALELIGLVDHVMGNAERMGYAARVRHGLWPATFVLCSRDAILRPDLHRHTDHVVALLTQQVSSNAGVHSTAHAEQNALSNFVHRNQESRLSAQ